MVELLSADLVGACREPIELSGLPGAIGEWIAWAVGSHCLLGAMELSGLLGAIELSGKSYWCLLGAIVMLMELH